MGTLVCDHEIRRPLLDMKEQAKADDEYVRQFDRQLRDWPHLAQVCLRVSEQGEWEILGFHSYDAWLMDAAPFSRSMAYWAVATFKELSGDFTPDELREMPSSTARVMKQLSTSARRNPVIREAAKKKRRDFVKVVKQIEPHQHVEDITCRTITLTDSQDEVVEKTFAAIREKEPELTDGAILELLCAGWWASA